ncbi:hypothetical protein [Polyangium spumosum]|uniref:Uncharacterized protein n=1 Tax=Polyangium spumosum TaxID=889282 RepID=A0A6N7PYL0_9BACT|nr:hypothetical protein [Polyangium spumosum]MRG96657.1 hypothetical protein [Polyangium spumosum]
MSKRGWGRRMAGLTGVICLLAGAAYAETPGVENEARPETAEARSPLATEPTLCARCMRGCLRGDYRWWPFNCEELCAVLLCRPERRAALER